MSVETSSGSKPADPYTAKTKDDIPLSEKVSEFTNFIKTCKFGMMTTRIGDTGQMTSRAMALAATVRLRLPSSLSSLHSSPSLTFPTPFAATTSRTR